MNCLEVRCSKSATPGAEAIITLRIANATSFPARTPQPGRRAANTGSQSILRADRCGALAKRTVARAQLLRPFPHFDGVAAQKREYGRRSSYHALEAKVEKRYSSGLNVLVPYTFSKMIDYGTGPFGGELWARAASKMGDDLAAEWGSSTLDQTHSFVFNTVYELPFFRERFSAVWQIGGIWRASPEGRSE